MGFQVGNVSKTVTESGGTRELKLGWLDMQDYDDLDEDDYKGDVQLSDEQQQLQQQ
jgi:hypothetical protein